MLKDIENTIEQLTTGIKEFTDVAVLGLSGGVDSTLVAILCKLALGKKNVYGVHMPCENLSETINLSLDTILENNTILCYLRKTYLEQVDAISCYSLSNINKGNIKARLRMTTLYSICQAIGEQNPDKKCRVIGTTNLSEYFIGYFTKYGDGGADFEPIQDLYKSEVYQLLDYFKDQGIIEEKHIDRIPSAGLWEGQTDESELGFTYDELEIVMRDFETMLAEYGYAPMNKIKNISKLHKKVLDMHIKNIHKLHISEKIILK